MGNIRVVEPQDPGLVQPLEQAIQPKYNQKTNKGLVKHWLEKYFLSRVVKMKIKLPLLKGGKVIGKLSVAMGWIAHPNFSVSLSAPV